MFKKRALSSIITTTIIILISLVAVTTIWFVINNLIKNSSTEINIDKFSTQLEVLPNSILYEDEILTLTIKRTSGNQELKSIKFIIENESSSYTEYKNTNLQQLEIQTFSINLENKLTNPTKLSFFPVFDSENKKEQLGEENKIFLATENKNPNNQETPAIYLPQCSDGIDNDNDGKTDLQDSNCVNSEHDNEFGNIYYIDPVKGINPSTLNSANMNLYKNNISKPFKTLSDQNLKDYVKPGDLIFLREGIYTNDYYAPSANSGVKGNSTHPITIKAFQNEKQIFTGNYASAPAYQKVFALTDYFVLDGITIYNSQLGNSENLGSGVLLTTNSKGNIIRNCNFTKNSYAESSISLAGSDYNIIENNTFDTINNVLSTGTGMQVYIKGGNYNLIQNNYCTKASHSCFLLEKRSTQTTTHNIIKNNTIEQYWGHGIGVQFGAESNLIENNKIFFAGAQTNYTKTGIQIVSKENIIRKNIIAFTGFNSTVIPNEPKNALTFESYKFSRYDQESINNIAYNNVIYKTTSEAIYIYAKDALENTGNKIINNIIYKNKAISPWGYSALASIFFEDKTLTWNFPNENYIHHNLILHSNNSGDQIGFNKLIKFIGNPEQYNSLDYFQTSFPTFFYDNIEQNPKFIDADNKDFRLQTSSPAIDAGAFLTKTISSGNSNSIQVEDARFFTDGFGIIQGDEIKIGNNLVKITSINYNTNTLTVNQSITFSSQTPVSLPYKGNAPDIGAYETA